MCLQWADFAVQHKGTSYKLHVYVAWAKELNSDINHGSQTDLMDGAGLSAGTFACLMVPGGISACLDVSMQPLNASFASGSLSVAS